jgi:hypothetical protein
MSGRGLPITELITPSSVSIADNDTTLPDETDIEIPKEI